MYQITGSNFSELITREFTSDVLSKQSFGEMASVFECKTNSLRAADFDILRFSASFDEQLEVTDFIDTSHVSMHFQLSGYSNASISGLDGDKPMQQGRFNVFNCVDPVSSFVFPRQKKYEYICVGLKPSFFNGILEKCGDGYSQLLERSIERKGFSLFTDGVGSSLAQLEVLRLLHKSPVSDGLMNEYLKSKVSELVLLSLDGWLTNNSKKESWSAADLEKLQAVKEYLDKEYLLPVSLEGLARKFLLNEFKLKKGFRMQFGSTVFGHIHSLRMHHASLLLESGGLRVGEVAAIVGYTSDSSFIRSFRNFYGTPPGKTR
ncbi:helix-turn-helix transcriptional regulator [Pedobacter boryungensis]|uniref:Helix-turn-helix transcriptional regulator n=1 Tax=Pedobacter boryungensis TaxID=869962 RepID=A0ABX2D972_9SPHI|nr:AraC family transcriptional regulator [Pedobacter boryungensis]NQX30605.1 helix-turn-helix transcriptional regulator [Pedobacter boryungensis]